MDFQLDRPKGYIGKADQYLPDVIQDLKRILIKAQDSLGYKTLHLSKGVNLSEDKLDSIRAFIFSDSISPRFVRKLVQKYGDESIASVFLIRNDQHTHYLDYLLRRYKGHFFRNRYPSITLI